MNNLHNIVSTRSSQLFKYLQCYYVWPPTWMHNSMQSFYCEP